MAAEYGFVDVADVGEAHDDVPPHFFGKHLERLGLLHHWRKLGGVVGVGHAQEQSAMVALEAPHAEIACRRNEGPVEVVYGVAQHIVVGVDLAAGLKEFYLVRETAVLEDAQRLLVGGFEATEGHVELYNLGHALAYLGYVILDERLGVAFLKVAVVAARDGVLDEEL